jgi:hypothetical protein
VLSLSADEAQPRQSPRKRRERISFFVPSVTKELDDVDVNVVAAKSFGDPVCSFFDALSEFGFQRRLVHEVLDDGP